MDNIAEKIREVSLEDQEKAQSLDNQEEKSNIDAEPTQTELKAKEAGWHKGGKDRDGNELSADEFLARKPLFNKIHGLQDKYDKDITELKDMVRGLQDDNKKITVASMKKQESLMAQLQAEKGKALDDLDVEKVKELDNQIDTVRETISLNKPEPAASREEWEGAYTSFLHDNDWYDDKPGLAKRADMIARNIMEKDKNTLPTDLYLSVAKKIREEFPERFAEKKVTTKVGTTNNRGSRNVSKKQVRLSDLDPEEARIVRNMMDMTGKSEEEYLKNYEL